MENKSPKLRAPKPLKINLINSKDNFSKTPNIKTLPYFCLDELTPDNTTKKNKINSSKNVFDDFDDLSAKFEILSILKYQSATINSNSNSSLFKLNSSNKLLKFSSFDLNEKDETEDGTVKEKEMISSLVLVDLFLLLEISTLSFKNESIEVNIIERCLKARKNIC